MNTDSTRPVFVLPIILLGTLSLLYFGAILTDFIPSVISASLTGINFVEAKLKYQIVTFGIALLVHAITFALTPQNAYRFINSAT